MKMNKSVKFPSMTAHYGPGSHTSNPDKLPSDRNPGQKSYLSEGQSYTPAPGSPVPTQSSPGSRGIK